MHGRRGGAKDVAIAHIAAKHARKRIGELTSSFAMCLLLMVTKLQPKLQRRKLCSYATNPASKFEVARFVPLSCAPLGRVSFRG